MKKIILTACFFLGLVLTTEAQVKVGTNPTTVGTNSNVEVEAPNGGKFTVTKDSAKVIIRDGSQGVGKVFTSDANGKGTWNTLSQAGIPQLVLRAYNPNVIQLGGTGLSYFPPAPLVSGNSANYNPTTNAFTITEAGFYEYSVTFDIAGVFPEQYNVGTPVDSDRAEIRGGTGLFNPKSVVGVKWMEPGETLSLSIGKGGGIEFSSEWKMRRFSIVIYKR